MLKKEQTLLYYIKSEFKNRILFIHVNQIAVPENHGKIVTSLRIAHAREYLLDKEQISYDEVLVKSKSLKGKDPGLFQNLNVRLDTVRFELSFESRYSVTILQLTSDIFFN